VIKTVVEEPGFFQVWIEAFPKDSRERWKTREKVSTSSGMRGLRNLQLELLSRETGKP